MPLSAGFVCRAEDSDNSGKAHYIGRRVLSSLGRTERWIERTHSSPGALAGDGNFQG